MNPRRPVGDQVWHLLQRSDAVDEEMAAALSELVPIILWEPDRSLLPMRPRFHERERLLNGSNARVHRFPILRGFSHLPASALEGIGVSLARRLATHSPQPAHSPLVCTTSLFAHVAEHWPGPVIYWLTDLMSRYDSLNPKLIEKLDRQLCRRATLICPNSERLALYLREQAGCAAEKVVVTPNAARLQNILPAPLTAPTDLPHDYESLQRPLAGVIGNLAENMDWVFLRTLTGLTPWLSWVFVGSTQMSIRDPAQRRARQELMAQRRTCFIGPRPHKELVQHARAIDVAVLPYCRREPTYSGSSTRFYEHLAACRPILATPGVAELTTKEPLLRLVPTPELAAKALEELRSAGFDDGLGVDRWRASVENTWRDRAVTITQALRQRLPVGT